MSKEKPQSTSLQETSTQVPAYMQKFMQQAQNDADSMATSSISVPRLSFRGKRFRFVENGEEELVKELTVDVVILGVEPEAGKMIKTYYDKPYEPGATDPPTCSSSNGISPDVWVSDPQANYCSKCEKNVFGSAKSRSGGKSKACQDGKRLWVAKPDDVTKVYGLNCPVTSLKPLSEYGKFIKKNNFPLALVVTTLGMDDESEFPKLTFEHKGFVAEEQSEKAIAVNMERPWLMNYSDKPLLPERSEGAAERTVVQPSSAQPQGATAPKGGATIDDVVGDW